VPKRLQNVIQNFAAGVLSPRMSARVDFEAYDNSLKEGKNVLISPQGGIMFREGMEHIGIPPSNQPFRTFQFRAGGDRSDVTIEVSPGLIRYWVEDEETGELKLFEDLNTLLVDEVDGAFLVDETDGAFLAVGVTADSNPYTAEDLPDLYFTNQDRYGVLLHPNHPPYIVSSFVDGSFQTTPFPKERIPQWRYNDIKNPAAGAAQAVWRITFPLDWYTSQPVFFMTYNDVAPVSGGSVLRTVWATSDVTNIVSIETLLTAAAAQQGFATAFVATGVGVDTGIFDITITGDNAGWTPKAFNWSYQNYSFTIDPNLLANNPQSQLSTDSDQLAEPAWSYPTMVTNTDFESGLEHYYQCIEVHEAAADKEPGQDIAVAPNWPLYWLDLGQTVPAGFDYTYPTGNAWTTTPVPPAVVVTYFPADRGFPTVALYHDQRLLLMANKDNPTAVYGSGLGEYGNFVVGPEDDNPFIHVLDSSDTPIIKWAASQGNVILGTSGGDWNLKAEVTLTPTDIHAQQQNFARSDLNMVCQVDDEIFYIELGQKKLRSTRYVDAYRNFQSTEVSILAEHLVATEGIHRVFSIYTPEVMLVMLRNEGQPVVMTYDKNMPVLAFTEIETDGFVYDACGFYSLHNKEDYVMFATQRNGQYVLEKMAYPCGKICSDLTANNIVHMDAWVTGTVSGQTITGLERLEGKTVYVLIDDAWQIGDYVVNSGAVILSRDFTGSLYAVGLPYTGLGQTFEAMQASGSADALGTALGLKRRWNWLTTRLLNSALPQVYGQRSEDRTPSTPMNEPELQREGLQDVRQNVTGYGDGSITFVMDKPYPVYVVGFFGEYQFEQRK
jgi:hypothetical protein